MAKGQELSNAVSRVQRKADAIDLAISALAAKVEKFKAAEAKAVAARTAVKGKKR